MQRLLSVAVLGTAALGLLHAGTPVASAQEAQEAPELAIEVRNDGETTVPAGTHAPVTVNADALIEHGFMASTGAGASIDGGLLQDLDASDATWWVRVDNALPAGSTVERVVALEGADDQRWWLGADDQVDVTYGSFSPTASNRRYALTDVTAGDVGTTDRTFASNGDNWELYVRAGIIGASFRTSPTSTDLAPDGAGTHTLPGTRTGCSGATTDWECIRDGGGINITYANNSAGQEGTFTYGDVHTASTSITAVKINVYVACAGTNDGSPTNTSYTDLRPVAVRSGTTYTGGPVPVAPSATGSLTMPAPSGGWTATAVNGAEFGVEVDSFSNLCNPTLSNMSVEVTGSLIEHEAIEVTAGAGPHDVITLTVDDGDVSLDVDLVSATGTSDAAFAGAATSYVLGPDLQLAGFALQAGTGYVDAYSLPTAPDDIAQTQAGTEANSWTWEGTAGTDATYTFVRPNAASLVAASVSLRFDGSSARAPGAVGVQDEVEVVGNPDTAPFTAAPERIDSIFTTNIGDLAASSGMPSESWYLLVGLLLAFGAVGYANRYISNGVVDAVIVGLVLTLAMLIGGIDAAWLAFAALSLFASTAMLEIAHR